MVQRATPNSSAALSGESAGVRIEECSAMVAPGRLGRRSPVSVQLEERAWIMPLARIDLIEGKSVEYRRTIADVVYDKMIECLGVPEDRFQTIPSTRRRTSSSTP